MKILRAKNLGRILSSRKLIVLKCSFYVCLFRGYRFLIISISRVVPYWPLRGQYADNMQPLLLSTLGAQSLAT